MSSIYELNKESSTVKTKIHPDLAAEKRVIKTLDAKKAAAQLEDMHA